MNRNNLEERERKESDHLLMPVQIYVFAWPKTWNYCFFIDTSCTHIEWDDGIRFFFFLIFFSLRKIHECPGQTTDASGGARTSRQVITGAFCTLCLPL